MQHSVFKFCPQHSHRLFPHSPIPEKIGCQGNFSWSSVSTEPWVPHGLGEPAVEKTSLDWLRETWAKIKKPLECSIPSQESSHWDPSCWISYIKWIPEKQQVECCWCEDTRKISQQCSCSLPEDFFTHLLWLLGWPRRMVIIVEVLPFSLPFSLQLWVSIVILSD